MPAIEKKPLKKTVSKSNRFFNLPKNAVVMKKKARPKSFQASVVSAADPFDYLVTEISQCVACGLCKTRTQTVPGDGNRKARLMIVGEAPGEQEDLQGRPFVGRAGQLLEKMLEAIGLSRKEVFIANVIKCRPPENRNPSPEEVESCEHFLLRQLELIQPEVIIALGKFAAQTLLKTETPISQLRGNFYPYPALKNRSLSKEILLMPSWHPAYLLRNPSAKKDSWEDLKKVASHLKIQIPPVRSPGAVSMGAVGEDCVKPPA